MIGRTFRVRRSAGIGRGRIVQWLEVKRTWGIVHIVVLKSHFCCDISGQLTLKVYPGASLM